MVWCNFLHFFDFSNTIQRALFLRVYAGHVRVVGNVSHAQLLAQTHTASFIGTYSSTQYKQRPVPGTRSTPEYAGCARTTGMY